MTCQRKHDARATARRCIATAVTSAGLLLHAAVSHGQPAAGETFASAEQAVRALYRAVRSNDQAALTRILGSGKDVVSSEDPVADRSDRRRFVLKYEQMHRLAREQDGTERLYVGAENWSFPFPLVAQNGRWHFDADSGVAEMVVRRIGRNEIAAIEAGRVLAEAAARRMPATGSARRQQVSAAGDARLLAFQGYVFRRLSAGENDGVCVVAYPARYRVTGVMTFAVRPDGTVFEKDLGPDTRAAARTIGTYEATEGWRAVEGPGAASTGVR
jgi:hypothetical protein